MNEKMKNVFKQKRMIYLGIVVVLVVFAVGLNIAFSAFTSTDIVPAANITVGSMNYKMEIGDVEKRIITIPANTNLPFDIRITANNNVESKYELYYETCTDVTCSNTQENISGMIIEYNNKKDPVFGEITANGIKEIRLRITNNTENAITIRLNINAGFIGNSLSLRSHITQKYFVEATPLNQYILEMPELVVDNGYRLQGDIANNFVTFNNELWRIIGVFGTDAHGIEGEQLVKLVRHEPLNNYDWNNGEELLWEESTLFRLLNQNYFQAVNEASGELCTANTIAISCNFEAEGGLDEAARQMIQIANWNTGAPLDANVDMQTIYTDELATQYEANVGLLTISDYAFSTLASHCPRLTKINTLNTCNSWLFNEEDSWLLTPNFHVTLERNINNDKAMNTALSVRPVVYLKSTVVTGEGTGTQGDPYQIGFAN